MTLHVSAGNLPGLLVIEAALHRDERGSFAEAYRVSDYAALGLPPFVQDNVAVSGRAVLRGLHLQFPRAQGKLISVLQGTIFDVAVDVRPDSPTFGRWEAARLDGMAFRQLYIPPGFAHGYQVLSDHAVVTYKCTDYYLAAGDLTLDCLDPALNIPWPIAPSIRSARDQHGLSLSALRSRLLAIPEPSDR